MSYRNLLSVALLLTSVAGCAKNGQHATTTPSPMAAAEPLREGPMTAETHFAAGQLAESRGDSDTALLQYKESLYLDKDHLKTLYRVGCLTAQLGKFKDSIDAWNHYLKATGDSAFGYSNLAYTQELAGNPAGAEADYKRGIARDPENAACRINYGLMLARHGRYGEATIQLQAVLEPAQVHYNLASVYELQHRKEMAKIEYQQALALDPNFADARAKLASLGDVSGQD